MMAELRESLHEHQREGRVRMEFSTIAYLGQLDPGGDTSMKVLYNWLKEFVDVTASPEELASRLALSGTNIAGIENGPHGAVIDAEVTSNRPDCLGHATALRANSAPFTNSLSSKCPAKTSGKPPPKPATPSK